MLTDPISDMLIRIKNAYMARKREVVVPASKVKARIAELLKSNGYIGDIKQTGDKKKELNIKLVYKNEMPAMESVKRISKPGRRVYKRKDELPNVLNGRGVAIVSTSKGIMTNKEAKKQHVGGEIICEIY